MNLKINDTVWGVDEKNIVNNCYVIIKNIYTLNNGTSIYLVKFDHGSFLLKENQITKILK